jgi:hypothetical protein
MGRDDEMTCDDKGVPWVEMEPWDDEAGVVGGPKSDEEDGVLCNACTLFTEGDWSSSTDLRFCGVIDWLCESSSGSGLGYRGMLKLLSRREGAVGLVYLAACARSSSRLDLSRKVLKKVVDSCWGHCFF